MEGVGGGEGVVDLVPVGVVVLGVEAGDAQGGGIGDGPAELLRTGAGHDGVVDGGHDLEGIVGQDRPGQPGHAAVVVEAVGAGRPGRQPFRQPGRGLSDHAGQVVGVAPRPPLLAAGGGGGLGDEGGEDVGGALRPEVLEHLEGLVGEVDRVPAVEEHVVGDRGEHHVGDDGAVGGGDGRGQRPLGGFGRAGLDEAPVPRAQPLGRRPTPQRPQRETRRAAAGVAGDEGEPGHQRQRPVGGVEVGQDVGHGGEHREPGPPAGLAVAGAEAHARPHDGLGRHAGVEEGEHGLGHDQRDALLQPLLEAVLHLAEPVGLGWDDDHDPVALDLDGVGPHVVGPGVERAAGPEVEAGVVPVARHQAALDGAPVERKAHVGAAVIEGERRAVAPEDADGLGPRLSGETAGPLQLAERPDRNAIVHGLLLCRGAPRSRLTPGPGRAVRRGVA